MKKYINFLTEKKSEKPEEKSKFYLLLKSIYTNGDNNADKIIDFLGPECSEYNIADINDNEIAFNFKDTDNIYSDIELFMGYENGTINFTEHITSYGYENYVDDSENEYINTYINEKLFKKIQKFAKELDYNIVHEDNSVYSFILDNELDSIFESFRSEISSCNQTAVNEKIDKEINEYEIFSHDWGTKNILFYYSSMMSFMDEFPSDYETLDDVLIEFGNQIPYSFETEYDIYDYVDYKTVPTEIENELDYYWDDEFELINDDYWIGLIEKDNVELIKKYKNKITWEDRLISKYSYKKPMLIFDLAEKGSKIHTLIWSDEFIKELKGFVDNDFLYELTHREMRKKSNEFNI